MTGEENVFHMSDMTDEEIDAWLLPLAHEIEKDESRTAVINIPRMKQFEYACAVMKKVAEINKASFSYKLNEPFRSIGSVSITGKNVKFKNPQRFFVLSQMASNFEIYPKTDGTFCMTFTFHNMTKPIE